MSTDRLSLQEYAERRRSKGLPGGTRQAVAKAVHVGRITATPGGMIDARVADRDWTRRTRPSVSRSTTSDYATARAERERYQAKLLRLEYPRLRGELIPRAEVRDFLFQSSRVVRDILLGVPGRAASEVVGRTDLGEVERILEAEIGRALDHLVEGCGGGPGE